MSAPRVSVLVQDAMTPPGVDAVHIGVFPASGANLRGQGAPTSGASR
jgi:hypothetical protein